MYVYTREKSNENPGVLNSCTYIGSAASTYGIAVLSDRIGWSSTLLVWALLAFAGTLICMACARPWRKKFL
jgi:OPA family glycerol-3-phosphate transporter-like MFS transporter